MEEPKDLVDARIIWLRSFLAVAVLFIVDLFLFVITLFGSFRGHWILNLILVFITFLLLKYTFIPDLKLKKSIFVALYIKHYKVSPEDKDK